MTGSRSRVSEMRGWADVRLASIDASASLAAPPQSAPGLRSSRHLPPEGDRIAARECGPDLRETDVVTESILTDGVIELRPPTPEDAPLIIAGRDVEFRRFIGEGSAVPAPEYVIVVGGCVVRWVDSDRWWLAPDEVNIGYYVFPADRGRAYATRARSAS